MMSRFSLLTTNVSGVRLTIARQRRGWTKAYLAECAGLSAQSITAFEHGQKRPSEITLDRLSEVLDFPLDFFYGDDLNRISPRSISFRSRRTATLEVKSKTVATGQIAASCISPEIRRRFSLPKLDLPSLSDHTPEEAAENLRNHWKLGQGPIKNMVHLVESKGIEVYWQECNSVTVDAVSFWMLSPESNEEDKPFILLDITKEAGERGRFDVSHELGHLVLHRNSRKLEGKEIENEADRFASAFLMPSTQFRGECPKIFTIEGFLKLKKRWGTSIQSLVRRAKDTGIFSEWQYESAYTLISREGYRIEEPGKLPRESSAIHKLVMSRLDEKCITPQEFAKAAHINIIDLLEIVPESKKYYKPTTEELSSRNFDLTRLGYQTELDFE